MLSKNEQNLIIAVVDQACIDWRDLQDLAARQRRRMNEQRNPEILKTMQTVLDDTMLKIEYLEQWIREVVPCWFDTDPEFILEQLRKEKK